jgi:predicted RNase H-like nuclease
VDDDIGEPDIWVAGVEGCKGGWVAALRPIDAPQGVEIRVFETFAQILMAFRPLRVVAVDMPIGLPERVGHGGRGPEAALRSVLGGRQSSVFAIPSRKAVHASDYPAASEIAAATSDPPRKVSKQAFHLFPKIREVDALLRSDAGIAAKVFECHPEGAFRMMRGAPLIHPKKLKSAIHPPGLAERRTLLSSQGYPADALSRRLAGAGYDDVLDACAASWTAARIARGEAEHWPSGAIAHDAFGLPIAIWT